MAETEENNPVRNDGSQSEPVSNGTGKSKAALREERVLAYWQENKIFEKSLKKTEGKKEFIFYEGPPTANAKPALHHLAARAFKDVIPRYKTMRGFHVRRKAGWDTHGLPVELQVEKKLGLNSKKAIEEYGVAKFNKECRESVWEYVGLWDKFTERIGFWVDQKNPYVTYHNDYIESVWNIVKKINEQKLLYKDYKVVPWCPRCGTALSSHELAQGYEDVKDLSVYVKFKVRYVAERFSQVLGSPGPYPGQTIRKPSGDSTVYILAWTTTPWTLPGNVALAVGKNLDYVKVKTGNEIFILAKERLSILTDPYEILEKFKGKDLIGLEYEPLYPYLASNISESEKPKLEKAYKIYPADFVSTEDGTGVVHTAVMYGQDDFELGTKIGLPKHHLVGLDGKFLSGTEFLKGRFVKDEEVAVDIIKNLAHRGLLFKKEKYEHSYPHCWRCKTALIYYARDSWYIKMSDKKIKKQLISENKEINWEPAHIRDGRFGEWLKDIKDWAISRERYWGTPLPVWFDRDNNFRVIGSIGELKSLIKKSGNKYFVMRHGGSVGNIKNVDSLKPGDENDVLTNQGKEQVKSKSHNLKEKIDLIISSNFVRTKQTAEIMTDTLGLSREKIIVEEKLREFRAVTSPDEDNAEVRKRMISVLEDLEKKYSGKNILIVSHEYPLRVLLSSYEALSAEEESHNLEIKYPVIQNAEISSCNFLSLPRDDYGQIDLHRPFIDTLKLVEENGSTLTRVKEVMDVWFDSGAMPFAQDHYPFANKKWIDGKGYPADYISEAIDQTRGWFYTLHAVGVLMGRGKAYKNVICLGHLLDVAGKKMSKSVGNVVDPWEAMDKYGVDTLRLWMYSVNQPGESKNFDEKTVQLLHQQVFGLLYNVLAFYELYRDKNLEKNNLTPSPFSLSRRGVGERSDVLDQWILAKLNELVELATENLDNYKLLEPVRGVRDFIGDLSTWYLRRSRERIKEGDKDAKKTLLFVLKTLAKVIAPFAPFAAEDIWLKLKNEKDEESVHLVGWPASAKASAGVAKIIKNMQNVRKIVSLGLEARQKARIQVRQPLGELKVKSLNLEDGYVELIKDEVNVKNVTAQENLGSEVELDTKITPALKAEGEHREFMRELQDKRKKMGLAPGDKMVMSIEEIYKKYKIMPNLQEHMLRVAAVASIICDNFEDQLPKEEIITACLLHDMGNIIKFKMDVIPEFFQPEGLECWQEIKNEYIKKYGENEHEATMKIIKDELGLPDKITFLVDQIRFSYTCRHRDSDDFNTKITHYSDGRVNPYGIVSYEERMNEGKKRYKDHKSTFGEMNEEEREKLVDCGREIEKQIFSKCKIKPEDINDESVRPIISELRNFVIK